MYSIDWSRGVVKLFLESYNSDTRAKKAESLFREAKDKINARSLFPLSACDFHDLLVWLVSNSDRADIRSLWNGLKYALKYGRDSFLALTIENATLLYYERH